MEFEILDPTPIIRVTTDISEIHRSHLDSEEVKEKQIASCNNKGQRISNSNQLFHRKKILHPFHVCNPYRSRTVFAGSYHPVPSNARNSVSSFTQRIMSAKLLKVKQLQNQLTETQSQLNEQINENRLLKSLQKRQDNALKKYEGSQEQLPQLLKTHNEDMRVLETKYKQIKVNYRELENKLKQRDTELNTLKQQHSHLVKLSKDKHLGDRDKLTKRIQTLEKTAQEQHDKIQMLNRKLNLESKNHRHQLNIEINKHKELQNQLTSALNTIKVLKCSTEGRDKGLTLLRKKLPASVHPSVPSHVSLAPPRVSIRQAPQRLVHSEASLRLSETGTTSNSSVSNVSIPSHISNHSSHDDGTDDTLTCKGNEGDTEWKNGNEAQDKSDIAQSSSDDEDSNENWTRENEKPFSFNEASHQTGQSQKNTESNSLSTQRRNNFFVGKLSNVGQRRQLNDKSNFKNRNDPLINSGKTNSSLNKNVIAIRKEGTRPTNIISTPSSSSSAGSKSLNEETYGNLDLYSNSLLLDGQLQTNFNTPTSLESLSTEKELQQLFQNATISDQDEGSSIEKIKENILTQEEEKAQVSLIEKMNQDAMCDIDKLVEEACKGMVVLEGGTADFDSYTDLSWDELQKKVKPIKNEIFEKLEMAENTANSSDDTCVSADAKADILKALDEIHQQEKNDELRTKERKNISAGLNNKPIGNCKKSPKFSGSPNNFKSYPNKFDKKKKSDIMRELFGEKAEMFGQS